ncbi:hypothetical protein [Corynebacterium sp.]|uniref:hypothetical protein n=1 Tax=Corynebacterium sp. TaxID=1720 RepID=UPI0026DB7A5E|nr:hypothetical protein [Corynebacterium sp.]MDO5076400.1 hypothetical protein [Corynebacterium sp.]
MKTRGPVWVRRVEGENAGAAPASADTSAGADSSGAAQAQDADSSGAESEQGAESTAEHWKAQTRKWERRAKDNQAAAETLKKLEDANKTELQKAEERATQAEHQRAAAGRAEDSGAGG